MSLADVTELYNDWGGVGGPSLLPLLVRRGCWFQIRKLKYREDQEAAKGHTGWTMFSPVPSARGGFTQAQPFKTLRCLFGFF